MSLAKGPESRPDIDPNSGENLLEVMAAIPKPDLKNPAEPGKLGRPGKPATIMPLVVAGPWTRHARAEAARKEVQSALERYFNEAMDNRNWSPYSHLPVAEMRERGHMLSDNTKKLVRGFLGVEDYVGDYVNDGLNHIGKLRERRDQIILWGAEETRHAAAWHQVLVHSGLMTEKEIAEYREEVASKSWLFAKQYPFLTPDEGFTVVAFTPWQERGTWSNYKNTGLVIRQEYGLPAETTPEEKKRYEEKKWGTPSPTPDVRKRYESRIIKPKITQFGAAGVFKLVGSDELAHFDIFMEMNRIYIKYLPDLMLDANVKVLAMAGFPAMDLIPDAGELMEAIVTSKVHTARDEVKRIREPLYDALGIKGSKALKKLEKAAQQAKIMAEELDGPQHVAYDGDGNFVLSVTEDPEAA